MLSSSGNSQRPSAPGNEKFASSSSSETVIAIRIAAVRAAEYRPATATLVVRVPGTPATLRSELLHEFAHHVEFVCADHELLRPGFLATQGFAPDTPWFGGATWESTPSEQYAEAVVELVEGRRTHLGGIILSDAAVAAVADWGSGAR